MEFWILQFAKHIYFKKERLKKNLILNITAQHKFFIFSNRSILFTLSTTVQPLEKWQSSFINRHELAFMKINNYEKKDYTIGKSKKLKM